MILKIVSEIIVVIVIILFISVFISFGLHCERLWARKAEIMDPML